MTTYAIDNAHSEIGFTVRHMMFAKVRGTFNKWTADLAYDAANPAKSTVEVQIDTASIDTREAQRDGHLRSADFFDTEKFPKMTFASKRIEPAASGRYKVTGDLTLHGVTREVTLDVEQTGTGKDPWGNQRILFTAHGSVNRSDFGLKWNQALETGGVLVSDKVDISVEAEVMEQKLQATG
jgi:polyisoprenoid-binding protein YceI